MNADAVTAVSLCEISMRPNEVRTFSRLLAQQLKLLARVHKSISLLRCLLHLATVPGCKIDSCLRFRTCRLAVSRQSSPRWFRPVQGFPFFASVLQCSRLLRGNTKKGHQRSLFEPRRAERTCALQTSDHRRAASNAPLEELLRSRREQLRQNPKFATVKRRDAGNSQQDRHERRRRDAAPAD